MDAVDGWVDIGKIRYCDDDGGQGGHVQNGITLPYKSIHTHVYACACVRMYRVVAGTELFYRI